MHVEVQQYIPAMGLVAYVLLQIPLGIWVSRKISNQQDYFLAGRTVGPLLASFSIFATWFGAETCIGSSASVFENGLAGSRAEPLGFCLCIFISGLFFAKQLWQRNLTTLADLFRQRFSVSVEIAAACVMIPTSLIWSAAQIKAFGQVLSSVLPWDLSVTIALAASVVMIYTFFGGMMGDILTDFIQAIVLILGLLILTVAVVHSKGGLSLALSSIESSRLHLIKPQESLWAFADSWVIPIFGSLMAQELISRLLSCKSGNVARQSALIASAMYLAIGLLPAVLGLVGPSLLPELSTQDHFLPSLAKAMLPMPLYIVLIAAIVSAILSTVDSSLLTISAVVTQNMVIPKMGWSADHPRIVPLARMIVIIAGIVAWVLAFKGGTVYEMAEEASSFGSAGVLVVTVFALWSPWGGKLSALMTLVTGVFFHMYAEHVLHLQAPYIATLLACVCVYLIGHFLQRHLMRV